MLRKQQHLLVDELLHDALVGDDTLGEPKGDLLLGVVDGVGTVAQVAADVNAEVYNKRKKKSTRLLDLLSNLQGN